MEFSPEQLRQLIEQQYGQMSQPPQAPNGTFPMIGMPRPPQSPEPSVMGTLGELGSQYNGLAEALVGPDAQGRGPSYNPENNAPDQPGFMGGLVQPPTARRVPHPNPMVGDYYEPLPGQQLPRVGRFR